MRERDYYPAGAYDDPAAPWNEVEQEEIERECEAYFEVRKTLDIATQEYVRYGFDDTVDTSFTDWRSEYSDRHYDPVELIGALADVVRQYADVPLREKARIRRLLNEAEGWEIDNMIVEEA